MSYYGSRKPHYIEGKTEEEVRIKLNLIADELGQKMELVNIYENSRRGKVIAWYYHDVQAAPLPPTGDKDKVVKKKKVSRKKVTKKA